MSDENVISLELVNMAMSSCEFKEIDTATIDTPQVKWSKNFKKIDKDNFSVCFGITIHGKSFDTKVEEKATFFLADWESDEERTFVAKHNPYVIIYPYLRNAVYQITGLASSGPFLLKIINVLNLIDQID
ncbi:MAG: protein-export chaperone SecB [Bacilli bacterium]|jgi:preprotein translocase subunit SecB|nr:protein-export chaperone SecB [Bacilli bacterium]